MTRLIFFLLRWLGYTLLLFGSAALVLASVVGIVLFGNEHPFLLFVLMILAVCTIMAAYLASGS